MGVAAGRPVLDRSPTFDAGALPGARWTLCCFTYNGAIGKSPDAVNIAIFFAAAAASFIPESTLFKNFQKGGAKCRLPYLAFALLCLIGVLFAVFTFAPPHLPLFEDPITGTYGIPL